MHRSSLKVIMLMLATIMATGCASYFKRKECNKINWFDHGKGIAMKGKRVDEDTMVKECQKVEADVQWGDLDSGFKSGMATYCDKETVFNMGKDGEKFNKRMCDGPGQRKLVAKHKAGVRIFCRADNGYRVAAKGWVYNQICPEDLEKNFMTEYDKGRKVYLKGMIDEKSQEMARLRVDVNKWERERRSVVSSLGRLKGRMVPVTKKVYDKKKKKHVSKIVMEEDPSTKRRRATLNSSKSRLDKEIRTARTRMKTLEKELGEHKREFAALR
jgi:prefoldin subunit 5